eukprot:scaffold31526_cov354-Skeletonema_menzelii.AAC.1
MKEAVPLFFGQSKYPSFLRQLSMWGFKRLNRTGPGKYNSDSVHYYYTCAYAIRIPSPSSRHVLKLMISSVISLNSLMHRLRMLLPRVFSKREASSHAPHVEGVFKTGQGFSEHS